MNLMLDVQLDYSQKPGARIFSPYPSKEANNYKLLFI